jgi:hypothetical protein
MSRRRLLPHSARQQLRRLRNNLWLERRPALEEAKALLLDRYNVWRMLAEELEADLPLTFGR